MVVYLERLYYFKIRQRGTIKPLMPQGKTNRSMSNQNKCWHNITIGKGNNVRRSTMLRQIQVKYIEAIKQTSLDEHCVILHVYPLYNSNQNEIQNKHYYPKQIMKHLSIFW